MAHDIRVIGNYIIDLCMEDYRLTVVPFMKFLYFAHGWYMGRHPESKPLVNTEFKVWGYGPTSPVGYSAYVGRGLVKRTKVFIPPWSNSKLAPDEKRTVELVVGRYKEYHPYDLIRITHAEGTPWFKHRHDRHATIPNDVIADHYRELERSNPLESSSD